MGRTCPTFGRRNLSDLWRADSFALHSKFKIQNSKFLLPLLLSRQGQYIGNHRHPTQTFCPEWDNIFFNSKTSPTSGRIPLRFHSKFNIQNSKFLSLHCHIHTIIAYTSLVYYPIASYICPK